MIIHSNMILLFIVTGLAGAVYIGLVFDRMNRSVPVGALIGAVVGIVGPMIFMVPLQSCTFEPEREALDLGLGIVLFGLGAALLLKAAQWVVRFFLAGEEAPSLTAGQEVHGAFRTSIIVPILLLAPTLVILVVFLYYPLLDTFSLATKLVRLGAPRTVFRCVDNFTELLNPDGFNIIALALALGLINVYLAYKPLRDAGTFRTALTYLFGVVLLGALCTQIIEEEYFEVLFNTFFISAAIVVIGLILGLAIAYLAYQPVRGAAAYRTLLIWPYAISPAVAGLIFFVMFDPVSGVINHGIELLGGQGADWIRDPWLARFAVIITSVWKTLGYNILFYIAGLQTVPRDLVEAAAIDGANAWQRFRNITIPMLSPITFFLIVTNITYSFFSIFGTIEYLTRGGPVGATSVSIYEIFDIGIRSKDLGAAAAQSIVLFVLVIGVTVFQFKTSGSRVTYGA